MLHLITLIDENDIESGYIVDEATPLHFIVDGYHHPTKKDIALVRRAVIMSMTTEEYKASDYDRRVLIDAANKAFESIGFVPYEFYESQTIF